jgi:hypothetical protein
MRGSTRGTRGAPTTASADASALKEISSMQASKKIVGLGFMAFVLVSATAMAQTLQQKAAHEYSEKMVNDELTGNNPGVNTPCGTTITAEFEWAGFDRLTPDSQGNIGFQPGQFARECAMGIAQVCIRSPRDGKAAIQQKVKKLVIAYGGQGHKSIALTGGTLKYTIDPKIGSSDNACREWLQSHL